MTQLRPLMLAATQHNFLGLALVVLCLGVAAVAVAQDDDLLALSLDQLIDLEVTTASKQTEHIHDARASSQSSLPRKLKCTIPEIWGNC